MTRHCHTAAETADVIIDAVGKTIVLGLPVGIGKAIHIADALYERAVNDSSLSLTIFTGLTLEVPEAGSDLERRFLEPFTQRMYSDWPTPAYAVAVRRNSLPANIEVREFYMRPGAYLGNPLAQQNYTSINYSHVAAELMSLGVNVIAQLVSARPESPGCYSLSSNPEVTLDLLPGLEERRRNGEPVVLAGQVNRNLPYMPGAAELAGNRFDLLLDNEECRFPLFALPRRRVSPADYATAMHVASLVPDGATLQIGIGSLSDAVAHCLRLRHESPDVFSETLRLLPGGTGSSYRASLPIETEPFDEGLYSATELLSDALYSLFDCGLIRRPASTDDATLIHAGFFIGSAELYEALRALPEHLRKLIRMSPISWTNTLFGDEATKRQQRRKSRFVNETMMATLLGAAVSDSLDDGRIISGVGGQFDFVSMAQSLDDALSILMVRANRLHDGELHSNILWSYAEATVPRHHRDVYVSEYGVAATRGRPDSQVIEAMLAIADSSFQGELQKKALAAGKLPAGFNLHEDARNNTRTALQNIFLRNDLRPHFPDYPLGTEFTATEQKLAKALVWLKHSMARPWPRLQTLAAAALSGQREEHAAALARMGLDNPSGLANRLKAKLVNYALKESADS
ncbi:MAG: acetyl-CoA hydrolase/transferase C-terminal domain-containing protein [Woeseiaceae bacterium]|nr:acetyl-CoA hydrolase/transferase C-terminal domain-containing protein [Woeseiaceae bacterium]